MARPPKFDDDEILDRAMSMLWRNGWAQTSIRDLEAVLDLKAPSIYRRFGSKEGLGAAVIDHYVDRVVRRRVDRFLSGDGDPIDNLTTFLERSVTQSGDRGRLWGCLLTTSSIEAGDADPSLVEARQRGFDTIEDGLRREVRRAAELGRLAEGVDPEEATATLALVMQGLMALSRSGASSAGLRRRARASVSTIASSEPTDPG
ncbi:MAG: TetR/AcrR family transcriptional regulator [Actinomycetota bacterium]